MQLNIDEVKKSLCRQIAIISLIERSRDKALRIACNKWYEDKYMKAGVDKQNAVTQRLVNYLLKLREEAL